MARTTAAEATRKAFLLGLLSGAASTSQGAGRRLILDQDREVTAGPEARCHLGEHGFALMSQR